jgi:hypothetical protein
VSISGEHPHHDSTVFFLVCFDSFFVFYYLTNNLS